MMNRFQILLSTVNLRPSTTRLLAGANDVGALVSALPDLLDPRQVGRCRLNR